jgi:hypothetical protein
MTTLQERKKYMSVIKEGTVPGLLHPLMECQPHHLLLCFQNITLFSAKYNKPHHTISVSKYLQSGFCHKPLSI